MEGINRFSQTGGVTGDTGIVNSVKAALPRGLKALSESFKPSSSSVSVSPRKASLLKTKAAGRATTGSFSELGTRLRLIVGRKSSASSTPTRPHSATTAWKRDLNTGKLTPLPVYDNKIDEKKVSFAPLPVNDKKTGEEEEEFEVPKVGDFGNEFDRGFIEGNADEVNIGADSKISKGHKHKPLPRRPDELPRKPVPQPPASKEMEAMSLRGGIQTTRRGFTGMEDIASIKSKLKEITSSNEYKLAKLEYDLAVRDDLTIPDSDILKQVDKLNAQLKELENKK